MDFTHNDILLPLAITVIIDGKVRDPEMKTFVARARGLVELFELSPMSDAEILAWFEKDREVLTEKLQGKMRNTVVLRALSRFTDSRDVENVFDAMVAISVCDQEYVRSESDLIKSAAAIYGYERPPIKVDR